MEKTPQVVKLQSDAEKNKATKVASDLKAQATLKAASTLKDEMFVVDTI